MGVGAKRLAGYSSDMSIVLAFDHFSCREFQKSCRGVSIFQHEMRFRKPLVVCRRISLLEFYVDFFLFRKKISNSIMISKCRKM